MKRTLKVLKIDVEKQSVYPLEISNDIDSIYYHIGCKVFDAPIRFPNEDILYCDDESLLYDKKIKGGFLLKGYKSPIIGNALIIGCAISGSDTDCESKVDDFTDKIIWYNEEKSKQYAYHTMNNNPYTVTAL